MIGEVINRILGLIPNFAMFPLFLVIGAWFLWQGWSKRPTQLKATLAKVG